MTIAKKKLDDVENYRLETLVRYFDKDKKQIHRALDDCELTFVLYQKLNEIK